MAESLILQYDIHTNTITEYLVDNGNIMEEEQMPASMNLLRRTNWELNHRRSGGGGKNRVARAIIREVIGVVMKHNYLTDDSYRKHEMDLGMETFLVSCATIVLTKDGVVIFETTLNKETN